MTHDSIDLLNAGPACCEAPPPMAFDSAAAATTAAACKALGHPVRVQILDLLRRYEGQVCVCDIERCFNLAQPTISHHLRTLRAAGLVGAEQRGLWSYYYLRRPALAALQAHIAAWTESPVRVDERQPGNR